MSEQIQVGQTIHATKMASDSFYVQAIGVVTSVRNGFVNFEATRVMDRWSKEFSDHPTSCATSCRVENAQVLS